MSTQGEPQNASSQVDTCGSESRLKRPWTECMTGKKSTQSFVRRSAEQDIDELLTICRQGFPYLLRWQSGNAFGNAWWRAVLRDPAVETWVAQEGHAVAAFCILICDEVTCWQAEPMPRHTRGQQIIVVLNNPLVVSHVLMRFLRERWRKLTAPVFSRQLPLAWGPKMRTWIHLICVRKDLWGRGFAGMLLDHVETRTRELGRSSICLRVLVENDRARELYERRNYECFWQDHKQYTYVKFLGASGFCL